LMCLGGMKPPSGKGIRAGSTFSLVQTRTRLF
jgi:hypothetical protein